MSRRHRNLRRSAGAAGADSLDLLLGPMCNTFGGIVLTAVVLALLSREVDVSTQPNQQSRIQATADTLEIMQRRLAKADEDLTTAQAFAKTLEKRAQDPALGDRLRLAAERLRLRQELQAAQQDAKTAVANPASANGAGNVDPSTVDPGVAAGALKAVLNPILREAAEQDNIGMALDENLTRLRQRQAALDAQLRHEKDSAVRKWRLPKERSNKKEPFYVILRYGSVFARDIFREGVPEANSDAVESATQDDKTYISPRQGHGLDPKTDAAAIENLFKAIPAQDFYIAFVVYQDSFGVFDSVKAHATRLSLDYGWEAFRNGQLLIFSATGHAPAPPL